MSEKTFTVVGTSVHNGETKLRLANGAAADRYKVLVKAGHDPVTLYDMPAPMTAADAAIWLAAQGDTVPVRPVAAVKQPNAAKEPKQAVTRVSKRAAKSEEPVVDNTVPVAHEELGRAASGMSLEYWNQQSIVTRQEVSRNAAWAQGIACPKGTYAALEAWLKKDGVHVNDDGTLVAEYV